MLTQIRFPIGSVYNVVITFDLPSKPIASCAHIKAARANGGNRAPVIQATQHIINRNLGILFTRFHERVSGNDFVCRMTKLGIVNDTLCFCYGSLPGWHG